MVLGNRLNATFSDEGNVQYNPDTPDVVQYNNGDIAFIILSYALVWLMIPGLGFFYGGLSRRKNALSLMFMSLLAIAVVSIEWFIWGYSLTFADDGTPYIGTLKYGGLKGVLEQSMGTVPMLLHALYQGAFACITVAIALGAIAERGRLGPSLVFAFCWTTIVYNPIACWTWNSNGWIYKLGGLDFAGGSPVHIASGTAALAYSIFIGRRRGYGTAQLAYRPHSPTLVILGTVFLWFGWTGFNGGSALGANLRAVQATLVTNIAASAGGLTWMMLDYRLEKKLSAVGFCSGVIGGLVAITPASGYVGTPAALLIGVCGGAACNFATRLKNIFGYDDALDIFAAHGVGGIVGNLLTAFFAQSTVASFDGSDAIPGGWIDHHYRQMGYQLADTCATFAYSFVLSYILLFLINIVPGLKFRASEEAEIIGMDDFELGEIADDFVSFQRQWGGGDGGESGPASDKAPSRHSSETPEKAAPRATATEAPSP